MADRKGKARAWSAGGAVGAYVRDRPISGDDKPAARRHLIRAYLAGIKAAREIATGMRRLAIGDLTNSEQARLGMSPQAKRKSKSGEGRK